MVRVTHGKSKRMVRDIGASPLNPMECGASCLRRGTSATLGESLAFYIQMECTMTQKEEIFEKCYTDT